MRVYTSYLGKGGVLKSEVSVQLALYCAANGLRTALLDTDYQGDATSRLGVVATEDVSMANVLRAPSPAAALWANLAEAKPNLWVAPASLALADVEAELEKRRVGRMTVLRNALRNRDDLDVVVIDCPTSLNYLTFNALLAGGQGGSILVPCEPEPDSMRHLVNLYRVLAEFAGMPDHLASALRTYGEVEGARLGYDSEFDVPRISGLIATKVEPRALVHRAGVELLKGKYVGNYEDLASRLPAGTFAEAEQIGFPPLLGCVPKTKAKDRSEALRPIYAEIFRKLCIV